jgi:hypothetical protein
LTHSGCSLPKGTRSSLRSRCRHQDTHLVASTVRCYIRLIFLLNTSTPSLHPIIRDCLARAYCIVDTLPAQLIRSSLEVLTTSGSQITRYTSNKHHLHWAGAMRLGCLHHLLPFLSRRGLTRMDFEEETRIRTAYVRNTCAFLFPFPPCFAKVQYSECLVCGTY